MAKIFLDPNEIYGGTIGSNSEVIGNTGSEAVTLAPGATGVVIDSQVEKEILAGTTSDYNYLQVGNHLKIYSGNTLVSDTLLSATAPTKMQFANGTVDVVYVAGSETAPSSISLGGATVTAGTPTSTPADADPVTPVAIDTTDVVLPVVAADQAFNIAENSAADTLVGQVAATDAASTISSYVITSGNDDGYFAIDATGKITVTADGAAAGVLDAEGTTTSFTLGVKAIDARGVESAPASVTIGVSDVNDNTPVLTAPAAITVAEAGAAVTGQLVATDADVTASTLTYKLVTPVEGLTLDTATGAYTFDPAANAAANALAYNSANLPLSTTFTVSDGVNTSAAQTLNITVTPKPLTYTITADKTSAEEGATTVYTVTASEALATPVDVVFTLQPGEGTAVDTGTTTTNTADFATGAFNPTTVTIAAGSKTATFNVVAVNDAKTELQESYTVKAEVAGLADPLTLSGKVVDATGAGGVGQTFTLTTGIDTVGGASPNLKGSANSTGTDGNDTIVALIDAVTATNTTLNSLDSIDAGLGTNSMTLNFVGDVNDTTGATDSLNVIPGGVTISNVQTLNLRAAGHVGDLTDDDPAGTVDALATFDVSGINGLTAYNITLANDVSTKAAATTAVSVSGITGDVKVNGGASQTVTSGKAVTLSGTTGAINVSGATDAITIDGGKNITVTDATAGKAIKIGDTTVNAGTITVTDTKVGSAAIAVDGGTDVTLTLTGSAASTIKVGQGGAATDLPTGAVTITSTSLSDAPADVTLSAITATGGSTITVTQTASSTAAATDTSAQTITQGAVTVTGSTATTSVTVNQTKAVAAVNAATAVAGVTETASVKFGALKANDVLILGGNGDVTLDAGELQFKATVDMTAAEVAAAFAGLTKNALPFANSDTQAGGPASKGIYSGELTGWTSAAASGDTVVFTSTTANTDVTDLGKNLAGSGTAPVITTTAGSAATAAKTGVLGVANGAVVINDNTTAASIKTITVDGYATGSTIGVTNATKVLDTLTLKNASGTASMTVADTAATLALTVEGNGTSTDGQEAVVTFTAAPTTLNVTATGNNYIDLTAVATETLTVAGTGLLNVADIDLAALKTVTVSGSAGLVLNSAVDDTLTSVNTTATTGAVTVTIDGTKATYTGGAGVDSVTVSNAGTAITKAIDLGGNDDTLKLVGATTVVPTTILKGGDGTDTLSIDTASAAALGGDALFKAKLDSFEHLTINDAAGNSTVDLANLGFTNYVTTTGSTGTLTLNNLDSNGTVVITTAPTTGYTVGVKDAGTAGHTTDVLNLELSSAALLAAGTVTAANVETINIKADDTDTTAQIDTMTLVATKATTINIEGDASLNLTNAGNTAVTLIDASKMTGGLTVQAAAGVASTIKGGSGADVLTASGGATGGTAQVSTLTFTEGAGAAAMAAGDSIAVTINGITVTQAFSTNLTTTLTALQGQIDNLAAVNATIVGSVITITAATPGVPFTANTVFIPNDANITGTFAALPATTLDRATMTIAETTAMDAGDSLSFTITDAAGTVSTITQAFDTDLATTIDGIEAKITAAGYTVASEVGGVITIEGPEAKGNFTVSNATFTDNTTAPSAVSVVTGTAADAVPDFLDTATLTLNEIVTMGADDTITVTVTDAGGVQTSTAVAFNTDFDTTMGNVVTQIEALMGIDAGTTGYVAGTNVLTVGSTRGQITNLTVSVTDAAMNSVTSAFATTTANVTPIGDTLIGNAGNDTLNSGAALGTMTGGEGRDLFVVNAPSTNVNAYTTITDFTADDLIQFTAATDDAVGFKSAKVTLGPTAQFTDYANAAINALAANEVGWFQFNDGTSTDTYLVMDSTAGEVSGTTFENGSDFIVKLAGVVDLTNASFNNTHDTIAL